MATNILFDSNQNPIPPTLVLAKRDGSKCGILPAESLVFKKCLNAKKELFFKVHKMVSGKSMPLWDQLRNFKLLWAKEWDLWFEIYVETDETDSSIKNVTAVSLGEAELSQINLYGVEINTEADILRDDFKPTVFYNPDEPDASLLDRIFKKVPHYSVKYVATSLMSIQRSFHFHDTSIYAALQEVAEELNCLIDYSIHSDENGFPVRTISVYDLESYCLECRHRGNFTDICPECGCDSVWNGYGEDSRIFISTENLAEEIQFATNVDSVKNCFRLEAGDELMTATIINCNPNGSNYLYYISDELKEDMPLALVDKLNEYDEKYAYYQKEHIFSPSDQVVSDYNALVSEYNQGFGTEYSIVQESYTGFPDLMNVYYDTIDLKLYLEHSHMPSSETLATDAFTQAGRINSGISQIAVYDVGIVSATTVDNAALLAAKTHVDYRYQVKVKSSRYDESAKEWTGIFTVTNYYDEKDTADTESLTIQITDNYFLYVSQTAEKTLKDSSENATDIIRLFSLNDDAFKEALKYYSLERLNSFFESSEACMNVLIEQNAGNAIWADMEDGDLYNDLYVVYRRKQGYIGDEIKEREADIAIVIALQDEITKEISRIQEDLHFETFLGEKLWKTFSSYRREDSYVNSNYISDGLSNTELIANAREFINKAEKDIYRSAVLQHSISATLKNLLAMREFRGLTDYFDVGNWIHVRCDGNVYHLRLLEYEIEFNDLENISVVFSDVQNTFSGIDDTKSIQEQTDSLMSTYDEISKQASNGNDGKNILDNWTLHGLDLTHLKIINNAEDQEYVFDEHGMVFRKYQPMVGTYSDEQLKIVNSTIAMTDNNWENVKTAIGKIYYIDPTSQELKCVYGVNAEVVIGKLILGEELGIYNDKNSMVFDDNGLKITNTNVEDGDDKYSFEVNPNGDNLLVISKENSTSDDDKIFWVDKNGKLYIRGNGSGLDISSSTAGYDENGNPISLSTKFSVTADGIKADLTKDITGDESGNIREYINNIEITAEGVKNQINSVITDSDGNQTLNEAILELAAGQFDLKFSEITKGENNEFNDYLSSQVNVTADGITSQIAKEITGDEDGDIHKYINDIKITAEGFSERIETVENGVTTNTAWIEANSEKFQTYVGDFENQVNSIFTQNAGSIEAEIRDDLDGEITSLKATDKSISANVSSLDGRVAKVETDLGGITTQVSGIKGDVSTFQQTANTISSKVENLKGDYTKIEQEFNNIQLGVYDGDKLIDAINISTGGVTINGDKVSISADSIDLLGYVTANEGFEIDLEGNMVARNGTFHGSITADTHIESPEIYGGNVYGSTIYWGDYNDDDITACGGLLRTTGSTIDENGNYVETNLVHIWTDEGMFIQSMNGGIRMESTNGLYFDMEASNIQFRPTGYEGDTGKKWVTLAEYIESNGGGSSVAVFG